MNLCAGFKWVFCFVFAPLCGGDVKSILGLFSQYLTILSSSPTLMHTADQ